MWDCLQGQEIIWQTFFFAEVVFTAWWNICIIWNGKILLNEKPRFARWRVGFTWDIYLITHRIKATYKDALLRWISYLPPLVVFSIFGSHVPSVSKILFSLSARPCNHLCISLYLCFNKDEAVVLCPAGTSFQNIALCVKLIQKHSFLPRFHWNSSLTLVTTAQPQTKLEVFSMSHLGPSKVVLNVPLWVRHWRIAQRYLVCYRQYQIGYRSLRGTFV